MNLDRDVAEYLLYHRDGMKTDLESRLIRSIEKAIPTQIRPGDMAQLYVATALDAVIMSYFRDAIVSEVVQMLTDNLHFPYHEVLELVNAEYLEKTLGSDFFLFF